MTMSSRPNILFFFTDQQRWDTCGCYGQKIDLTPNLDRMAEEGVLFENAFSCQPVCGPARAALQTGKYPTRLGCHTNNRILPLDENTIAKQLSAAGYETAYIGKWHLASQGARDGAENFREKPVPVERRGGYRDFWLASDVLEFTSHSYDGYMYQDMERRDFPEGKFRVDVQTDWTIEYLQDRKTDRPFFLFLSYIEPHHQNDHGCYEGPHGSKERYAQYEVPGDLEGTNGDWRQNYPDYLGCINALDTGLGRIRDALAERGELDNTIIIFTSDHGSHFCTRNGEYKRSCHDGCIRVPMVISGPGFTGGTHVKELASLIDLPPTIITSAGLKPIGMDGFALNSLAAGAAQNWQEEVFLQISESQCGRAIRSKKWTYSVEAPGKSGGDASSDLYVEAFLYDNETDPHQKNNLVAAPETAGIRAHLRERLIKRMVAAGETAPKIQTALQE